MAQIEMLFRQSSWDRINNVLIHFNFCHSIEINVSKSLSDKNEMSKKCKLNIHAKYPFDNHSFRIINKTRRLQKQ